MKYIDISCVNTKNTRNNDRDIYKQSNPFGVAHINIGTINTKFTRDTEKDKNVLPMALYRPFANVPKTKAIDDMSPHRPIKLLASPH